MGNINTSVERRENFSLSLGMDEKERQLTPNINDEWRNPSKETICGEYLNYPKVTDI